LDTKYINMIYLNLEVLKNGIRVFLAILSLYFIVSMPSNQKIAINLHSFQSQDTIGDYEKNNLQYKQTIKWH
jgi:hypothetical protein